MKLTAKNVHDTFLKCLFKKEENTDNHVLAEAINVKIGFHPERLKENEQNISDMLNELPIQFRKDSGGGWSFLQMCEDKDGKQWADLHQTMDELVALGLATKKLSYCAPRELWEALPGGMPYLVIN